MSSTLLILAVTTLLFGKITASLSTAVLRGNVTGTCEHLVKVLPGSVYLPSTANYSSLANENWSVQAPQLHSLLLMLTHLKKVCHR